MKKILIVGTVNNDKGFLYSLINNVKKNNDSFEIDMFQVNQTTFDDINDCFNKIYFNVKNFPSFLYKIKFVFTLLDLIINMNKIKKKYDIVNFHYISYYSLIIYFFLKNRCENIVISPWGSDIYRAKKFYFYKKRMLNNCQFITVFNDNPMKQDIIDLFSIKDIDKFVNIGFGSNVIDEIIEQKNDKVSAKRKLGYEGDFLITCGYNGKKEQNHISILNSINAIKKSLPQNTTLIIPMSYGASDRYKKTIKNLLLEYGLGYDIIETFLSNEELASLRIASDVFIHAQTTDAFSASVQEHILAGSKVFNAGWVRYDSLENYGLPYITFDSFEELSKLLENTIIGNINKNVSNNLLEEISNRSWKVVANGWCDFYNGFALNEAK